MALGQSLPAAQVAVTIESKQPLVGTPRSSAWGGGRVGVSREGVTFYHGHRFGACKPPTSYPVSFAGEPGSKGLPGAVGEPGAKGAMGECPKGANAVGLTPSSHHHGSRFAILLEPPLLFSDLLTPW